LRILIAPFVIDAQMDRRIFALRAISAGDEAVIPSNRTRKILLRRRRLQAPQPDRALLEQTQALSTHRYDRRAVQFRLPLSRMLHDIDASWNECDQ
jgi:hypothetical protein